MFSFLNKLFHRSPAPAAPLSPPKPTEQYFEKLAHLVIQDKKSDSAGNPQEGSIFERYSPATVMDMQFFALLVGDSYIKDTDYEGGHPHVTIDYFVSVLVKNKERFQNIGINIDQAVEKYSYSSVVAQEVHSLKIAAMALPKDKIATGREGLLKKISTTAERIAESVTHLKPGESLLLPGGWGTLTGGHQTIYEIIKRKNGSYDFKVYNTGDGLQHHAQVTVGTKNKFSGLVYLENVSAKTITSQGFFKSLLEVNLLCWMDSEEKKSDISVYLGLLERLGGQKKQIDATELSYLTPQRSGTCSWKSVLSSIRSYCSSYAQYRKFKYVLWCQIYSDFYHNIDQITKTPAVYRLVKSAAEKFGKSIYKSFSQQYISQLELDAGLELIKALLDKIERQPLKNNIIEQVLPIQGTSSAQDISFDFNKKVTRSPSKATEKNKEGNFYPKEPDVNLGVCSQEAVDKVLSHAKALLASSANTAPVEEYVTRQIATIPVPQRFDDINPLWRNLPERQREEMMRALLRLQGFLQCFLHQLKTSSNNTVFSKKVCSPRVVLSSHHLFAVMDVLARTSKTTRLPINSRTYGGYLRDLLTLEFVMSSQAEQIYKQKIIEYFKPSESDVEKDVMVFSRKGINRPQTFCFAFNADDKRFADEKYVQSLLKDSAVREKLYNKGYKNKEWKYYLYADLGDKGLIPAVDGYLKKAMLINYELYQHMSLLKSHDHLGYRDEMPHWEYGQIEGSVYDRSVKDHSIYVVDFTQVEPYGKSHLSVFNDQGKPAPVSIQEILDNKYDTPRSKFKSDGSILFRNKNDSWAVKLAEVLDRPEGVPHLSQNAQIIKVLNASVRDYEQAFHTWLLEIDKADAPFRLLSLMVRYQLDITDRLAQQVLYTYLHRIFTMEAFKEKPLFIKRLKEVFTDKFNHSYIEGDLETSLFVLEYLYRAESLHAEITNVAVDTTFYKERIVKLTTLATTESHKARLYQLTAALHIHPFPNGKFIVTKESVQDILRAVLWVKTFYQESTTNQGFYNFISDFMQDLMYKHKDDFISFFENDEHKQSVMTFVAKTLSLDIQGTWAGNFPVFSCQNYTIDFFSRGMLKDQVRKHPHALVQLIIDNQWTVNGEWVESPDKKERIHALSLLKQKNIADRWYYVVPLDAQHTRLPHALKVLYGAVKKCLQSYPFKTGSNECLIPTNHEDQLFHVFLSNQQGEVCFQLDFNAENQRVELRRTINGTEYTLCKFTKNEAQNNIAMQAMNAFSKGALSVWKSSNQEILIELSEGVRFRYEPSNHRYESMDFKGYYLAESASPFFIDYPEHLQITHPKQGHKILCVIENTHRTFTLDEAGYPQIKNTEDAIYAAQVGMINHDYDKAHEYLKRAESLGRYTDKSKELLQKIIDAKVHHSDAVYCRMRALAMLQQEKLLQRAKIQQRRVDERKAHLENVLQEFTSKIMSLYNEYLSHYGKSRLPLLEPYLERLLWTDFSDELLQKIFPGLQRRYQELFYHEKAPYLQANAQSYHPLASGDHLGEIRSSLIRSLESFLPPAISGYSVTNADLVPYMGDFPGLAAHFLTYLEQAMDSCPSQNLLTRIEFLKGDPDARNRYLGWILELVAKRKINCNKKMTMNIHSHRNSLKEKLHQLKEYLAREKLEPQMVLHELTEFCDALVHISQSHEIKRKNTRVQDNEEFYSTQSITIPAPSARSMEDLEKELNRKHALENGQAAKENGAKEQASYHSLALSLQEERLFPDEWASINKQVFQTRKEQLQKELAGLEKDILDLGAQKPQDPDLARVIEIKRLAGKENVLTLQDMISLFILGDEGQYLRQTYLKKEQVRALDRRIGQWCHKKVLLQRIEEGLGAYEHLSDQEQSAAIEALVQQSSPYPIEQHREFLAFEAVSGKRLRLKQVEKLQVLDNKTRLYTVLHMIMGDGKSTVITPIWALLKARGDDLPFIIVPNSLYPTGKETTKATVYESFGKYAHAFEFDRWSDFSKEKLTEFYGMLCNWNREKGFVYATRDSVLSFILKAKELFYLYDDAQQEEVKDFLEPQVEMAWKIIAYLKKNCVSLLDEAHYVLNSRDEQNFTFGEKYHVDPHVSKWTYEFLRKVLMESELGKRLDIQHNNQSKITKEQYETEIKPKLIASLASEFHIGEEYLYNQTEEIPLEVLEHPNKDLIALGKALINTYLPHTLSRKGKEHFGIGAHKRYCIPFLGNNTPNEKAEFASYVETMLYTGYYYAQEGLQQRDVKEFVSSLKENIKNEMQAKRIEYTKTEGYLFFKKVTGLDIFTKFDIGAVQKLINADLEAVFVYVEQFVIPQVPLYPRKISANSHTLVDLFKQVQGMTGTPWNKDNYTARFETDEDRAIENRCQEIVSRLRQEAITTVPQGSPVQFMESILDKLKDNPHYKAVIDIGALFKGMDNQAVATKILGKTQVNLIDGVVFYNAQNELVILNREGMVEALEYSNIPMQRRVTYYDQRHTFGADIAQEKEAVGLITVSETTKAFEFFQAMFRMRGLEKQQTLHVVLPEDIKACILANIHQSELTPAGLLEFLQSNQQKQVLLDNFHSRKLEIKSIIENAIHEALINAKDFKERYKLFKKVKHLLIERMDLTPFEQFSGINKWIDAQVILDNHINRYMKVLDELTVNGVISNKDELVTKIKSLRAIPFAEKYEAVEQGLIDVQVENQNEVEVQTQVEVEVEQMNDIDKHDRFLYAWEEWKWPQSVNIFSDRWMKIYAAPTPSLFTRVVQLVSYVASSLAKLIDKIVTVVLKYVFRLKATSQTFMTIQFYVRLAITQLTDKLLLLPYRIRDKLFYRQCPIYRVNDVLKTAKDPKVNKLKNLFDNNFLLSNNFLIRLTKRYRETVVEPFALHSKPSYHLLVVQEGNTIQTMMIDQYDHQFFSKELAKDTKGGYKRKICIYDPVLGITQQGKDAFDEDALRKDPAFAKHLVFTKFWNGLENYSAEEFDILKTWVKEKGVKEMYELYKEILRNKDISRKKFTQGIVYKLFRELNPSNKTPARARA